MANPGIDPERLAAALAVLAEAGELPADHPDSLVAQRAASKLFKRAKDARKAERIAAQRAADAAVDALTATAAPGRIDDETRGLPLVSTATGATAGTLTRPRRCYVCKEQYTRVDAFYHQLCPGCAATHHAKRGARTDLTGRRALLTGGRAKIGMYIALRLLRDGAHTTITTRFPRDAARRFASMDDSAEWLDRLTIVGIDLRDPTQVTALADSVGAEGPLDILINNAAQTVRRSPGAYAELLAAEAAPLPDRPLPQIATLGPAPSAHPPLLAGALAGAALDPDELAQLALTAGTGAVDAGGLVPDRVTRNSWTDVVEDVDPVELLEVQLCNQTAPFILIGRLRAALASSPARRTYVVNVSAMEGAFDSGYKGPGHPHTNMAKAAVNMLTRTSARSMFEADQILMTSVDTGWITDERPHTTKTRLADEGFHAPLDLVDGAARVYDPIVRGEAGEDLYGCFLKDYRLGRW